MEICVKTVFKNIFIKPKKVYNGECRVIKLEDSTPVDSEYWYYSSFLGSDFININFLNSYAHHISFYVYQILHNRKFQAGKP